MLGDGGKEVSIAPVVYSHGTFSISSLGYLLSVGSFYKPSHHYFPLSLRARHIKDYSNKKRGRKQKFINPQQEKARHEDRMKRSKVTF